MIAHYSKTMQRNAYAISQNLSEMIAPSDYEALDENPSSSARIRSRRIWR